MRKLLLYLQDIILNNYKYSKIYSEQYADFYFKKDKKLTYKAKYE
jgi:hypothetical protein